MTITTTGTPPTESFTAKVKADYSYLTHHILLLAVTGILIVSGVYFVESLVARHDAVTAYRDSAILSAQVQQTQTAEKQLASDEAHWTQVEQTLLAQNAQLSKTIATENQQIAIQRKADVTLNAQQAAERLAEQTKASAGEVTANGDNIIVDLPITRDIVSSLDLLAGTQATLADTQAQLTNETNLYNGQISQNKEQAALITNLQAQNADEITACKAQVAVVKAQARKSKFKWFISGVVVGFIGKRILVGKW